MRDIILSTIQNHPKHYSQMLRRNSEVVSWVEQNSLLQEGTFAEKIYSAIHQESFICDQGNRRKFRDGKIVYCGPTKTCYCAKQAVSQKISQSKKDLSSSEKTKISSKRSKTNLERYGVENIGQTQKAKNNHKKFYACQENVDKLFDKIKSTTLKKYGVDNISKLDNTIKKRISTLQSIYGVSNPMQIESSKQKALDTKKNKYDPYYLAKQNYNSFIKNCLNLYELNALISKEDYIGVASRPKILFECIHCGDQFEHRFDYANLPRCKKCYPSDINYKSNQELELLEFCKTLDIETISGDRKSIYPYEIDIFFPEHNIGIEYCGLYWHSELSGKKSWNYHYKKWHQAKQTGIDLYTIYSDEWLHKKDIVKNLIASKIKKPTDTIFARKCIIKPVSRPVAMNFLNENHLQGSPNILPINVGLYYNNNLEAVMCFKRIKNQEYELSRFASKSTIIGGASKLLKYFENHYDWNSITSFSNNRYSNGNLYCILGFHQSGVVPPMQEYVFDHDSRIHKLAIKKHIKHIDEQLTEWQKAQSIGADRIWDCGKIRWTKNKGD